MQRIINYYQKQVTLQSLVGLNIQVIVTINKYSDPKIVVVHQKVNLELIIVELQVKMID